MPDFGSFKSNFDKRAPSYQGAILSTAYARQDGHRRILRGTLTFTQQKKQDDELLDYGKLILERRYLTCEEAIEFVQSVSMAKVPPGSDFDPVELKFRRPDWQYHEYLPTPVGLDRLCPWPASEYLLGTGTSGGDPIGPLVDRDLPLVVSPNERIDQWIGVPPHRLNIQTGIIVLLPDYRARIAKVRFEESSIEAFIETALDGKELLIKAALDDFEVVPEIKEGGKMYRIPMSKTPSSFHLFLLDRENGDVIDWAMLYLSWSRLPAEIEFSTPERQFERLISMGESQELEFKKERGDGFTIIQTIIAFANSNKGTVLIGVDDNGTLVGTDPESDKKKIVEWIERKCDPPVIVSFDTVSIDDKKLLAVSVPMGVHLPHVHRDNGVIYVRRGSTDRPASRTEIQNMFGSSGYHPGM
jgi:hypothetical protein